MRNSYHKVVVSSNELSLNSYDSVIVPTTLKQLKSKDFKSVAGSLGRRHSGFLERFTATRNIKPSKSTMFSCDLDSNLHAVVAIFDPEATMFEYLSTARSILKNLEPIEPRKILLDLRNVENYDAKIIDSIVSAFVVSQFQHPKYGKDASKAKKKKAKIFIATKKQATEDCINDAEAAEASAIQTNLVRTLATLPTNELTCKSYVEKAIDLSKQLNLKTSFISQQKLSQMEAGAFLSVARGSNHKDAGILKIEYKCSNPNAKNIALVGKGIVFDTGGINVKPGTYMFGMHGDMGGSAVTLATTLLAATEQWPVHITCYLAIAENAVSNHAFLPNEVVTASNGMAIEVVHTDAEGRMVLADTLSIASEEKYDLILDFATLTGSAVQAIGTTYSAGFTNNDELHSMITSAGKNSGERIWSFPLDKDFGESLKSDVADIKQCRLRGGVDHIEAAYFLSQFVKKGIDWIHIDLASCENSGGLGHVPTEVTGFGVRFARELIDCYRARS